VAKAEITTVDGVKLKVAGTPQEVAEILAHARQGTRPANAGKATKSAKRTRQRVTLPSLIEALREEKFFKNKQSVADIRGRLGELGNHYSGTTLGKQLLREVRGRRLRRVKDDGQWFYVA
jgi:hypothetical protein